MARESQRDEYLRKANEADIQKKLAKDDATKASWELVVVGFLELADLAATQKGGPDLS